MRNLVLQQVIEGSLSILWCHQMSDSKLANRNWDGKHASHRVHDLCLAPQIREPRTEMMNITSCMESSEIQDSATATVQS